MRNRTCGRPRRFQESAKTPGGRLAHVYSTRHGLGERVATMTATLRICRGRHVAVVLASGLAISLTALSGGIGPALAAPVTTTTYAPAPTHEQEPTREAPPSTREAPPPVITTTAPPVITTTAAPAV